MAPHASVAPRYVLGLSDRRRAADPGTERGNRVQLRCREVATLGRSLWAYTSRARTVRRRGARKVEGRRSGRSAVVVRCGGPPRHRHGVTVPRFGHSIPPEGVGRTEQAKEQTERFESLWTRVR